MQQYIENTYLKTREELGVSKLEHKKNIKKFIEESINMNFNSLVVRSEFLKMAYHLKKKSFSQINIVTVANFPAGSSSLKFIKSELCSSKKYINEIDVVCDYNAFKYSDFKRFDDVINLCTSFAEKNNIIIKWIIETGALSKKEIKKICVRIEELILEKFSSNINKYYIKTCTGYYSKFGADIKDIKLIRNNLKYMRIKASGGIKSRQFAKQLIKNGADKIGTSSGKEMID